MTHLRTQLGRATLATLAALVIGLPATSTAQRVRKGEPSPQPVARFDWFEYVGNDSVYRAAAAGPGEFTNPILAGFYPDPSITRVGSDYYLVTSTFSYFPGLPIFHSRDLVSWTQIGNAIDRPGQVSFDSLGMSRGLFAPAIEYSKGTFYIANTCVDCGGNFIITATDPRGPWSDPVFLPTMEGIDPSLFFDDDGKVYVVNNRAPIGGSTYQGHRAIWIQEYDLARKQLVGEATQIVNGGVNIAEKPIWIEGPHVYKIGGKYYLNMAEGGTAHDHRQVIMRADQVRGPYLPGPANPILTQRHLPGDRPFPVVAAGHADYVDTPSGEWWAVFLGARPYAEDYHNTGRETFLLPVRWENGWPTFVGGLEPIRYVLPRPALPAQPRPAIPTSGNFTVRDEFDGPALAPYWLMARTPRERWHDLEARRGSLTLVARPVDIASRGQPSFVGRRQQHLDATFTTAMHFQPEREGDEAGLVAWQSDEYFYAFTLGRDAGRPVIQLARRAGREPATVVAQAPIARAGLPLYLKIEARGGRYGFHYGHEPGQWTALAENVDGTILSTRVAGGFGGNFTGVVVGPYAHAPAR
ncbi:MAG TPA: glycoside hydrolase family 43 protein [Gemmatimonadaceae bacterium]|nr:glycoside hydrolase family 43 protein [Gemmatimonadaceae bacterium]